jgi:hypothetical protein
MKASKTRCFPRRAGPQDLSFVPVVEFQALRKRTRHMGATNLNCSANVLAGLTDLLSDLEAVYKDIHSHPELSMQEHRTAGVAADRLRSAGY